MRQLKITKQVTNREALSLDKYLHEIGKVELLSPDEEVMLARKIQKGDHQALETIVKANLRFVVSVAKQYQSQGLTLPDLINEGNLGLIKAAERFDETRGFKFISYAVWWIRQSILQALAEQARIVRLPLNKIGSINKINKTFIKLEQDFQREPTPEEIAEILDLHPKMVEQSLNSTSYHISMDAPLKEDDSSENNLYDVFTNDDTPSPDGDLIDSSLKIEIERLLSTLNEREAEILRYYYGLNGMQGHTLEEIGKELDLTRERVRQIKEKAIKKLKNIYRNRLLKTFLG
jgi:RNA polymerase primary sigma factor